MVGWILNFYFFRTKMMRISTTILKASTLTNHDIPVKIVTKYKSNQNKSFEIVKSGPRWWCFERHDDNDQWCSKETKTDRSWKTILQSLTKFIDCGGDGWRRFLSPEHRKICEEALDILEKFLGSEKWFPIGFNCLITFPNELFSLNFIVHTHLWQWNFLPSSYCWSKDNKMSVHLII